MKILTALTYYRPHISGLTIFAERLCRALAARGHEVTVLTMRYDSALPKEEDCDGVRIVRVPVLFRLSKGVIAPLFGHYATKLVRRADLIHLHLPQFDAAGIAMRGKLMGIPVVTTYNCSLKLPGGLFNQTVETIVKGVDFVTGALSNALVTHSSDYREHSPFLRRFAQKAKVVLPACEVSKNPKDDLQWAAKDRAPIIGMTARFAAEKGIEVLLEAFPRILAEFPNAAISFVGEHQSVFGESKYITKLRKPIAKLEQEGRWKFLGVLSWDELAGFYKALDVLVVPSLNSTEAFGLVQVEAMMRGTPAVASDLPGVRVPVEMTGMGKIAEPGKAISLAESIIEVLRRGKASYHSPAAQEVLREFEPRIVAERYEKIFLERRPRGEGGK